MEQPENQSFTYSNEDKESINNNDNNEVYQDEEDSKEDGPVELESPRREYTNFAADENVDQNPGEFGIEKKGITSAEQSPDMRGRDTVLSDNDEAQSPDNFRLESNPSYNQVE